MSKVLIITAHPGDFVWRAGGAIAKHVKLGHSVDILSLTAGARGEAPKLWETPDTPLHEVIEKRSAEAFAAADILGAKLKIVGVDDFPIIPSERLYEEVAEEMRASAPDIIVTHTKNDGTNLDHVVTHETAVRARMMVTSPGRGFKTLKAAPLTCFEPHYTEQSGFRPNLLIDITDVWEIKCRAIKATPSQSNLWDYYMRLAEQRGMHAGVKYAEAFQRFDCDVRQAFF